MTPLTQLPAGEFDRLVRPLRERRLPAFSHWGGARSTGGCWRASLDADMRRLGRRVALRVQRILAGEDAGSPPAEPAARRPRSRSAVKPPM